MAGCARRARFAQRQAQERRMKTSEKQKPSREPETPGGVSWSGLLGCPFCGAQPRSWKPFSTGLFLWIVQCRNCMCAESWSHKSQHEAEKKWNARPIENAVRKAAPLLRHYERQLAASLSCDSRSHDNDRKPRRLLNAILDALCQPNSKLSHSRE